MVTAVLDCPVYTRGQKYLANHTQHSFERRKEEQGTRHYDTAARTLISDRGPSKSAIL